MNHWTKLSICLSFFLTITTCVFAQEEGAQPSYKMVQAENYVYTFEVPLDWQMGQATLPDYDMIMGTSPDSLMQVYYHQYKTPGSHQEKFQELLVSMNPRTRTLAQYVRTTFDADGKPLTAYFAKGHGDYNAELRSFMLAGYQIDGKVCLILVLAQPDNLTDRLPLMRHILQL